MHGDVSRCWPGCFCRTYTNNLHKLHVFISQFKPTSQEELEQPVSQQVPMMCSWNLEWTELWNTACLCSAWWLRSWTAASHLRVCVHTGSVATAAQLLPVTTYLLSLWQLSIQMMLWFPFSPIERAAQWEVEHLLCVFSSCLWHILHRH